MARLLCLVLLAAWPSFSLDQPLLQRVKQAWGTEAAGKLEALLNQSESQGLPVAPLENKVREGLAKKQPAEKIMAALEKRRQHLSALARSHPGAAGQYGHLLFAMEKGDTAQIVLPKDPELKQLKTEKTRTEKPVPAVQPKDMPASNGKAQAPRTDLKERQELLDERMMEKEERMIKKMEAQEKARERREKARGRD